KIARQTPAEKMQMLSLQPGAVSTDDARIQGYIESQSRNLALRPLLPTRTSFLGFGIRQDIIPGQISVWAAAPEATFLHGRLLWAGWSMGELTSGTKRKKINSDPFYLTVGVKGV
ncbi:hypothetical protein BR93DRAFT_888124, partial [Coniochaeta sp. PMI_546]